MKQLLSICLVVTMMANSMGRTLTNVTAISNEESVEVTKEVEIKHVGRGSQESDSQDEFKEYELPEKFVRNGGVFPRALQEYTYEVCKRYRVDYHLVIALIEVESSYKPTSISHCDAIGYMQVMEKWHAERMNNLKVDDLAEPKSNILVGVDYLAELLEENPTELALSIYNRGYRNANKTGAYDLWERGVKHTSYSRKIVKRANELKKELDYENTVGDSY